MPASGVDPLSLFVSAPPQLVGVSALAGGNAVVSATPDISAVDIQTGDVVYAQVDARITGTVAFPAGEGWTLANERNVATAIDSLYWKRWGVGGQTDDTTPTITFSASGKSGVTLSVWRGCRLTGDPHVLLSRNDNAASNTMLGGPLGSPPDTTLSTTVYFNNSTDLNNHGLNSAGTLGYGGTAYNIGTGATAGSMSMSFESGIDSSVKTCNMIQQANGPDTSRVWCVALLAPALSAHVSTQIILTSQTWNLPAYFVGKHFVGLLSGVANGGGGGSGKRGATGAARGGGGGGQGGGRGSVILTPTQLGTSQVVTIGTPGVGGAAQTADDTNGNAGTSGSDVSFGALLALTGGRNGGAGTSVGGVANTFAGAGGGGGVGGGAGAATAATQSTVGAAGGGGGGGGLTLADVETAASAGANFPTGYGGTGGGAAGAAGAAGANGSDVAAGALYGGPGGGGGGSLAGGLAAGAGGNGGRYGGGGAGGAASANGVNSGAGGNGGPAVFVLYLVLA
jgi:hypothetical protein